MNADKLSKQPTNTPDMIEVDTRRAKKIRRTVGAGGLSLVAAFGAGLAYDAFASNNTGKPPVIYSTVKGDTADGIAETLCNPSPADLPKVVFNLDEANPNVIEGNGQLGIGEKLTLPLDMCDTSVK